MVKPNFCWENEARFGPGEYFLYLGRLVAEKGVAQLIEAWQEVDAQLVVAGDGPLRDRLLSIAGSNVQFLGSISPDKAKELLKATRALIVPSIWYEGAPRTIVEAYASGVPVIASSIGAIPEFVVDGVSGVLTPPGNAESIRVAARSLLDDATAVSLGEGGHELWKRHFTPEAGLQNLENCYRAASNAADPDHSDN